MGVIRRARSRRTRKMKDTLRFRLLASVVALVAMASVIFSAGASTPQKFHLEEATIADIQSAILNKQITTEQLVRLYLARIKAYNGTCVKEPRGILGPIETIPHAGQLNALMTLNLRPAARAAMGFDARKARSM